MADLGLEPGGLVSDAYRVVRVLGEGGMGIVVLARDERLDRLVAMKFVRPPNARSRDGGKEHATLRTFFRNEARAMARVRHPNVVTIHALGDHEGIPYFVMDYVDGPSVEEWLSRRSSEEPTDPATVLEILAHACLGVAAIHRARTVHRDLKPSNLLVDASSNVVVSDFGVARRMGERVREESVLPISGPVGSVAYMAPEAALEEDRAPELAPLRDIYALGCVAFELFTGRLPFVASSDMGLLAKHMIEPPPCPSSLRPDLPASLDAVVLRALSKDPRARFPTALAFAEALSLAVRASPEEHASEGSPRPPPRALRSDPSAGSSR